MDTVNQHIDEGTIIAVSTTVPTSQSVQEPIIMELSNNNQTTLKQRDSTQKSTKSLNSSMKTPKSSSITGFNSKNYRFSTCCGVLELNCLKLTSLAALLVSLIAFTLLVVIISVNYSIVSYGSEVLDKVENEGSFYRELMKLALRSSITSSYNRTLSLEYAKLYTTYFNQFTADFNTSFEFIPESVLYYSRQNITKESTRSRRALRVELAMISLVTIGNYSQALKTLDSDEYKYLVDGYNVEVQPIYDYITNLKNQSSKLDLATTTAALLITCISIVIVVPVLVVFVVLSLRKDDSKEKQLRQVKKYLIMDTINDPSVVEKFKQFCKQERSEENFALLEKINEYKRLCEKSFDIQVYLFDTDVLSGSDQVSEVTTVTDDSKKKNKAKKGYTEKDLLEIEKKKFEIAFEIFTDFLDVRGDRSVNISKQFADNVKQQLDFFAKGENESISETLFESIEYEMCVLMMDTHHRFKQDLERQLKQKKQSLSSLKKSKK